MTDLPPIITPEQRAARIAAYRADHVNKACIAALARARYAAKKAAQ